MYRRTLLAFCATLSSAGCLGSRSVSTPKTSDSGATAGATSITTPANRTYRKCSLQIIHYATFPEPVQAEIDAALADGKYTAEKVLLQETMNVENGYVLKDQTYYDPSVERAGDEQVLKLPKDSEPELRNGRVFRVENETKTELVVRVRDEEGQQIVEPTHLPPGDGESVYATNKIGVYDVELEFGEKTETFGWNVDWSHGSPELTVKKDGYDLDQAVASIPICMFEYETTSA